MLQGSVMSLSREQKTGGLLAVSAYTLWGVAPLYFKHLQQVPAMEILVHRIVWSFVLLLGLVSVMRLWPTVRKVLSSPRQVLAMLLTALLLAGNWGLFIWAINNHHMLDASLGYYINPLLNVVLGLVFLGERLRRMQAVAVGLAFVGVLLQVWQLGTLPWIALVLASSFAVYGLLRKKLAIDAISGLWIESLLLLPLALMYWLGFADSPFADLTSNDWQLNAWLVAAGIVTTVPLLCFIGAAKRIQLSTLGFFQYIGPSFMFGFGVFLFGEPLVAAKLWTFVLIWTALFVYSLDAGLQLRRKKPRPTTAG